MDPDQFDALVARLVAAQSRREALAGAVGGALASIAITSVAESRRGKHRNSDGRKKKKHHSGDHEQNDGQDGNNRGNAKHRRHRHNGHRDSKSNNTAQTEKKKKKRHDRCKKNGEPCARDGKCCSKHCSPTTGTCTRKPVS